MRWRASAVKTHRSRPVADVSQDAAVGILIAASLAVTAAAAPQGPLSDLQIISIAVGTGMMGGLVGALISDEALSPRVLSKRILASGLIAPMLVVIAMLQVGTDHRLLHVVAASGGVGLIAYPVAITLPKLAPSVLRDTMKKWIGGGS